MSSSTAFRHRHLAAFSGLFVQVLRLCQETGLVKLGLVAIEGTKIKANTSRHKAMSYGRMERRATDHQEQVDRLLAEPDATDAAEDRIHGHGKRGAGRQRFSFRGIKNVTQEWELVCLTHNLRKLFRHSWLLQSV